jgi:hypothetical protein
MRTSFAPLIPIAGALLMALAFPVVAQDAPANPNQPKIDEIKNRTALVESELALVKAQVALIKESHPLFGDDFGKKGALTIEAADRDKFHVTARSAEAFAAVAKDLADKVRPDKPEDKSPVVILVDADRVAFQTYWSEQLAIDGLQARIKALLGEPPTITPQALGTGLFEVGTLLSQLAQFTQLFRTDKSVSFTDSLLPDELLLDLVALQLPQDVVKYPSGEVDRFLSKDFQSRYGKQLSDVLSKRGRLLALGEPAKAVLDELKELSTRLITPDATTKVPGLVTALRGELVQTHVSLPGARTLSVKVASKGGTSLKTSSIWRSDRLYASGGLIVSYRVADAGPQSKVLKAGVVSSESAFVRIPLDEKKP